MVDKPHHQLRTGSRSQVTCRAARRTVFFPHYWEKGPQQAADWVGCVSEGIGTGRAEEELRDGQMRENMKTGEDQFGQDEEQSAWAQKACAAPRALHKELHSQAGGSQWRKENSGGKTTLLLGLELTLTTEPQTASLTVLLTLSQKDQVWGVPVKVVDFQTFVHHPFMKVLWQRVDWGKMGRGGMGLFSLLQPLLAQSCGIS